MDSQTEIRSFFLSKLRIYPLFMESPVWLDYFLFKFCWRVLEDRWKLPTQSPALKLVVCMAEDSAGS